MNKTEILAAWIAADFEAKRKFRNKIKILTVWGFFLFALWTISVLIVLY